MKVAVFLVTGFEPIEAIGTIDILRRCGIDVTTISLTNDKIVNGALGVTIVSDDIFENINFDEYKGIVAPGGPGTDNYFEHKDFLNIVKKFYEEKKLLAFICAAPKVLAELGFLNGAECTSFPSVKENLISKGGIYKDKPVVVSENIITGMAAGSVKDFAEAIGSYLIDKEEVQKVIANMYY